MTDRQNATRPDPENGKTGLEHPSASKPWKEEGVPKKRGGAPTPSGPTLWKIFVRGMIFYLVIFALLTYQDSLSKPEAISYTEFDAQVSAANVKSVFARGHTIEGELKEAQALPPRSGQEPQEGATYDRFITERPVFAQDNLMERLEASGAVVRAEPLVKPRGALANLLISFGPILLLVAFYVWIFRRQRSAMSGMGGMAGLGQKPKKPVDPTSVRVTFEDVAGIDEVENEISEIVDYLKDPERYRAIGAKPPKGVLLSGPPGTGKTLLARATAGEANVPFFSASASEFIEMIVGVGASRVRELFKSAREVAPSIIFIDEIDTIGRARGGARAMGGHDEREQTLNQILTEMDGFSATEGVIVLAATNRADVLDAALLRPGRFDRTIMVHAPDQVGRKQILDVHTRKVKLAGDADLEHLSRITPGMTGAELANLVNEAALLAVRRNHTEVQGSDFTDALEKVQLGTARNVVMPLEERRRTAYHEAGHALLGMLQPGADPVRKVSIIPRGRALGVTLSTPQQDRYGYTADYLRGRMVGALGGMAAEELVFGVVTTGAESDLETCTNIARGMVGRWGMSEKLGPVSLLPREGDARMYGVSEGQLDVMGEEVRRLIDESYAKAKRLLSENRHRLDAIVKELLEHETLDEPAIYAAAGIERTHSEDAAGGLERTQENVPA